MITKLGPIGRISLPPADWLAGAGIGNPSTNVNSIRGKLFWPYTIGLGIDSLSLIGHKEDKKPLSMVTD